MSPRRRIFLLLGGLIALKFMLVLIDGRPSVFMGDSGSYLYTALHDYIPHDRSWLYGLLLRPLVVWPHSLRFLVFAQAAMSAISAWLVAVILTRIFSVRFRTAALLSILCALEPLQLLSERYIMTDTLALMLFAVLTAFSVALCRRGSGILLAGALLAGVALIGIRTSYLPIVLLNSVLLPVIWFWNSSNWRSLRDWGLLLVWLGAGQLMLYGYECLNASVSGMKEPKFLYTDGLILVAEVAPIVRASDFPANLPGSSILASVREPLRDPMYREAQIFAPGGLSAALHREIPDEYQVNQVAKRIAWHAIVNHPAALARLAIYTWNEFLDRSMLSNYLVYDEGGMRSSDEPFRQEILNEFGVDFGKQSFDGPVWKWHRAAIPWYWFLVTVPLAIPVVFVWKRQVMDAASALTLGYLGLLFIQTIVVSTHSEARYLIPVAWLTFLCCGVIFKRPSQTSGAPAALREPAD